MRRPSRSDAFGWIPGNRALIVEESALCFDARIILSAPVSELFTVLKDNNR